eukprot:8460524-Karenia_brevis.AAC.1
MSISVYNIRAMPVWGYKMQLLEVSDHITRLERRMLSSIMRVPFNTFNAFNTFMLKGLGLYAPRSIEAVAAASK